MEDFTISKRNLTHKDYNYKYSIPVTKGSKYKCISLRCNAYVILGKEKNIIIGGDLKHNHPPSEKVQTMSPTVIKSPLRTKSDSQTRALLSQSPSPSKFHTPRSTTSKVNQHESSFETSSGTSNETIIQITPSTKSDQSRTDTAKVHALVDKIAEKQKEIDDLNELVTSLKTSIDVLEAGSSTMSCSNNPSKEKETQKRKFCKFIGDSNMRRMKGFLCTELNGQNYDISVYDKSGLRTSDVMQIQCDIKDSDSAVVLMVGTNDVENTKYSAMEKAWINIVEHFKHLDMFIVLVPPRFDKPHLNGRIKDYNEKLTNFIKARYSKESIHFIKTDHMFTRNIFSPDGLHFNDAGKTLLAKNIKFKLLFPNEEVIVKPISKKSTISGGKYISSGHIYNSNNNNDRGKRKNNSKKRHTTDFNQKKKKEVKFIKHDHTFNNNQDYRAKVNYDSKFWRHSYLPPSNTGHTHHPESINYRRGCRDSKYYFNNQSKNNKYSHSFYHSNPRYRDEYQVKARSRAPGHPEIIYHHNISRPQGYYSYGRYDYYNNVDQIPNFYKNRYDDARSFSQSKSKYSKSYRHSNFW